MKPYYHPKSLVVLLMLALTLPQLARADFNPVALTQSSYTFNIVVASNSVAAYAFEGPANIPTPTVNSPYSINGFVGTGTNTFGDNTYYEQGLYSGFGDTGYNSGVPVHGTVFTNINNANMTFMMPPSYAANDDLMIVDGFNSTITSGTLVFTTATTAAHLAILEAGGNNGCTVNWTVTHSDNSTDTGTFAAPDWFNPNPGREVFLEAQVLLGAAMVGWIQAEILTTWTPAPRTPMCPIWTLKQLQSPAPCRSSVSRSITIAGAGLTTFLPSAPPQMALPTLQSRWLAST